MNRRSFLRTAITTAGLAALPWKFPTTEERYWEEFHQRILKILERGYDVQGFVLYPEDEGFRFVTVNVKNQPPLSWYQPWGRSVDANKLEYENRIYDLTGCHECGEKTYSQHRQWCRRASYLFDVM
jgi:hypothetical protein